MVTTGSTTSTTVKSTFNKFQLALFTQYFHGIHNIKTCQLSTCGCTCSVSEYHEILSNCERKHEVPGKKKKSDDTPRLGKLHRQQRNVETRKVTSAKRGKSRSQH